jgi:hypothetical protein
MERVRNPNAMVEWNGLLAAAHAGSICMGSRSSVARANWSIRAWSMVTQSERPISWPIRSANVSMIGEVMGQK